MSYRQKMWAVSNGVLILTLAGGFWLGVIGSIVHRPRILGPAGIAAFALLLCGFVVLRRKSAGFSLAEMKHGAPRQQARLRTIRRGLRRAMLIEAVLCGAAVGGVEALHRTDLLWPALGIAVSLHFIALGRLFHVNRYYFSAAVGTAVCLLAALVFPAPASALVAAAGMCLNMWGQAVWLLATSARIAVPNIPN